MSQPEKGHIHITNGKVFVDGKEVGLLKWMDVGIPAADKAYEAFKLNYMKAIGLAVTIHGNAFVSIDRAPDWQSRISREFGEHPPRIFHEGP